MMIFMMIALIQAILCEADINFGAVYATVLGSSNLLSFVVLILFALNCLLKGIERTPSKSRPRDL